MSGAPLGPPRICPSCRDSHPVGTTCAGGWAPWRPVEPVRLTLSADDMAAAETHAREVIAANQAAGFRNKFEARKVGETEIATKVRGFAAEIAAARLTGLTGPHWELFGRGYRTKDKRPDIGARVDVKNARQSTGPLWIYKGDKPSFAFLLVTGIGPSFSVVGWIEGLAGMVDRWWTTKAATPAWSVSQYALAPLPLPEDA